MSSDGKAIYHLRYLNLRARGEPVRWLLKAIGAEYTEERIPVMEWPTKKSEFEWGRCPVLLVRGEQLHQTTTICSFLARTHNMTPADPLTAARLQEVAESIHDASEYFAIAFLARLRNYHDQKAFFFEKGQFRVYEVAEIINKIITEAGWIRGDEMTWVDIFVASYLDIYQGYFPDVFENAPKLLEMVNKVRSIPAIQSWLTTRPPLDTFELM